MTLARPTRVGARVAPGAISRRIATQERKRQKALQDLAKLRKEASAEIDRLISFLDASDAYVTTELEDQVDDGPIDDAELEPSFCGVTAEGIGIPCGVQGDELEADYGNGLTTDDEPSLGSSEDHPNGYADWGGSRSQEDWSSGSRDDLEHEHDGREPEDEGGETVHEDDEPSLGWPERVCQASIGGDTSDRELAAEPDVAAVRRRGRSRSPGVRVEKGIVTEGIAGLTPAQERALRGAGLRRSGTARYIDDEGSMTVTAILGTDTTVRMLARRVR